MWCGRKKDIENCFAKSDEYQLQINWNNYIESRTTGHLDDYYREDDFRCHYRRVTGLRVLRISSSVLRGLYFRIGGLGHLYFIVPDLSLGSHVENI